LRILVMILFYSLLVSSYLLWFDSYVIICIITLFSTCQRTLRKPPPATPLEGWQENFPTQIIKDSNLLLQPACFIFC